MQRVMFKVMEKTKERNAEMLRLKLTAGTLLQVGGVASLFRYFVISC